MDFHDHEHRLIAAAAGPMKVADARHGRMPVGRCPGRNAGLLLPSLLPDGVAAMPERHVTGPG
jgi:hypothetical protein